MLKTWLSSKNGLFAVRPFSALRDSFRLGYTKKDLFRDFVAGITVGIIAIPLSMALAIASGVAPQHGLYTAIVAGFIIALLGGSRFNISGPTAAFVVILYPITQQFGLSGLLIAGLMAGIILVIMAMLRLGRLIEYIPLPVTLGFTCGIGIVIATLQIKDFLGLHIAKMPATYIGKVEALFHALPTLKVADLVVGVITLIVLTQWRRLRLPIPGHLPAVIIGTIVAMIFAHFGSEVATIGSSFTYTLPDGTTGQGIPNVLPEFSLPWNTPNADGTVTHWTFAKVQSLLPAAFSMAVLGAIESLLSAVVLDNMTSTKHHSNNELLAQGIGNIVAPFMGGITATAAIARSTANVKAGGYSPISSVFHSLLVLCSVVFFAKQLSYLPLASMAALLMVVAWNMANVGPIIQLIRRSGRSEIAVLFICIFLTVVFDMVIAITVGVLLASLLFIRTIAEMTKPVEQKVPTDLDNNTVIYRINGPLFFAAADNLFAELHTKILEADHPVKNIILQCDAATILDAGGVHALMRFVQTLKPGQTLYMTNMQFQPLRAIVKAKHTPEIKAINFSSSLDQALKKIRRKEAKNIEVLE